MPIGSDAHRNREIRRILIARRIAIVAELIAVIAKNLAEIIELGPSFVARGAGQTVFPGKGRNSGDFMQPKGVGCLRISENDGHHEAPEHQERTQERPATYPQTPWT